MPKARTIKPSKGAEILIVEDSPTQSEQLRYLLEQNGYHVVAATNGWQALSSLKTHKPRLVISDVVMPEMDGYTLCREIKSDKDFEDIPVMLVTSLSDVRDVMKGLECGADHFVRKPYDEKYLLSHIDYLLMNRSMRGQQSVQVGIEIYLLGQRHFINAERQQILDLLISIYEEAVHMNEELTAQQEKLAHSHRYLRGLYTIAEALNQTSDEQKIVELAAEYALELPNVQASWIWLLQRDDNNENVFHLAASRNFTSFPEFPISLETDCQCRRQLLAGKLDTAVNIIKCERLVNIAGSNGTHISIPLGSKDNPLGVMNLIAENGRLFNDDELKIVYGMGHQIEVAITRARLHTQLEILLEDKSAALKVETISRKQVQENLQLTESKLNSILTSMEDVIYSASLTPPHHLLFLNPAAERVYGRPISDFYATPNLWLELIHEDERAKVTSSFDALIATGVSNLEYRIIRPDGEVRWLYDRTHIVYSAAGTPMHFDGIVQDITNRKLQEARILRLNRVYAVLSEINMSIVHIQDTKVLLETACKIATEKGGFKLAWIGMMSTDQATIKPLTHAGNADGYLDQLEIGLDVDAPLGKGPAAIAMREKRAVICNDVATDSMLNSNPITQHWRGQALERGFMSIAILPIEVTGQIVGLFALYAHEAGFFDEGELRLLEEMVGDIGYALGNIEKEHQLSFIASHDDLTGLPNRTLLQDRMRQAIAHAVRNGNMVAILFIDLDRFKNINDSLGHNIGDTVLKTAAQRLGSCIREVDTVARLGGDEFVVMLTGIDRKEDITVVAQKILEALANSFMVETYELFLSASIGISLYPKDGDDEQALLKNADAAMYRAKENGKNRFEFFTDIMNVVAMRRLHLENQLRQALERNEFVLYYQPQADLETGRIIGVEALVRWQHPEIGMVPPVDFIPITEETGLIVPLGTWVLETACRQAMAWQAAGLPKLRMGVNLSVRQFSQHDLLDTIQQILQKTGFAPALLDLELTESLLMLGADTTIGVLQALRKMGIQLSVDDFGTGYSSLSYLKRFPVTSVKIDQSFVRNITTDVDDAALARSIISMAHEMRLHVIAEGVETEGQLAFLTSHHCDEVQGYYLSRPLPADECAALLRSFTGLVPRQSRAGAPERTLLLVDDEVNIATSLKRLLRADGYNILTASSGKEGLELLAVNPVGVIISDQRMPEMTGVEFLRRAKELYPNTVRIVLSGYTELKSITDAINEGAIYKFLTKPWEDEQLRDHVSEAFLRYELKQENIRLARELEHANGKLSNINHDLEQRVEAKTQEALHNINILQVSQEILEHLSTAVIGIDDDGLIVIANRQANMLLANDNGGSLLGCEAQEYIPSSLLACTVDIEGNPYSVTLPDGRRTSVTCHRMGDMCKSSGIILAISLNTAH